MPNWCHNQLRIVGPRQEVRRFFERAHTGNDIIVNAIDVARVVDPSNESAIANAVISTSNQNEAFSFAGHVPEPEHTGDDWYDWRCRAWGTKWDAKDASLVRLGPVADEPDVWTAHVEFETPWAPPHSWLASVIKEHPGLEISLLWNEEQGITGILTHHEGEFVSLDASYEDLVELGWCGPYDPKFFEELYAECADEVREATTDPTGLLDNTDAADELAAEVPEHHATAH